VYYSEGLEPMEVAYAYRDLKRERKTLTARDNELKEQEAKLAAAIKAHVESGKLPVSMKLDGGGNVHQRNEIRPFFKKEYSDEDIERVLRENGLSHMLGKPNHNTLRGYVLQYLDDDESKPARERIKPGSIPSELLDMLVVEDNYKTAVNGL
jgi:hypothetical protein